MNCTFPEIILRANKGNRAPVQLLLREWHQRAAKSVCSVNTNTVNNARFAKNRLK